MVSARIKPAASMKGPFGESGMETVHLGSARRPRIQMHWDRVYILTLVTCFWVAAAEIAYFLA
jgi:hypothetical protein